MKYQANMYVNNGTRLQKPLASNNKHKLITLIRKCAAAERFVGNEAHWWVFETVTDKIMAEGYIYDWGYARIL